MQVTGFPNIFVFEKSSQKSLNPNGKRSQDFNVRDLHENNDILWASQPERLNRDKRNIWKYYDVIDNNFPDEDYTQFQMPEFNDELWQQEWYLVGYLYFFEDFGYINYQK